MTEKAFRNLILPGPWRRQDFARVGLCLAVALVFAVGLAAPLAAQDSAPTDDAAPPDDVDLPAGDTTAYIPVIWIIMLALGVFYWLFTMELVNRDVVHLGYRPKLWNLAFMASGLLGFTLALLVHIAFLFLGVALVIICTTAFTIMRNARVPEEKKIFTRAHLDYVFRRIVRKAGIKLPEGTLQRGKSTIAIRLLRKDGTEIEALTEDGRTSVHQSEAVIAVKEIIESAVRARATDIHLEPKESELNIRFRVDGILHSLPSYPPELALPMVSVVKVLADMDIAERRQAQDGTFAGELEGRQLDFRCASTNSVHGETLSIRLLDRDRDLITLGRLGMGKAGRRRFTHVLQSPHGMLIVAGPTGAGKTTTLYGALQELDAYQKNIMTIENPIEYRLDNITQTAINPKAGMTFANSLRGMLRQDPDVIMVGEIRDAETARTALQAAMTGHFVFTTIHANDAVTALFRLMDLGVEPYLVGSSLTAILSQRLVRLLCDQCKQPYTPKPEFLQKINMRPDQVPYFFKAVGCEACQGIGYYGRTGIFELLVLNDTIRDLIRGNPSIQLIKAESRKAGLRTLQEDGLRKVAQGITSLKELIRVTK
ncbi:MAG: GspE/PulE family protein [Alphaproteobacteria bacterium]